MRSGISLSIVIDASFFPDGMLIPAFSVSRLTFEMNFSFVQSIRLVDVIVFLFPVPRSDEFLSCALGFARGAMPIPMTIADMKNLFRVLIVILKNLIKFSVIFRCFLKKNFDFYLSGM